MRCRSTARWFLLLAGLLFSLASCGGSETSDAATADTAGGDDAAPTTDVDPGADATAEDTSPDLSTTPDSGGAAIAVVDTGVAPTPIRAGESAVVTCSAASDKGVPVDADFAIDVSPAEGGTLQGETFTPERAGTYEIACRVLPGGPADESPFVLVVQPGDPVAVIAAVAPPSIEAGADASVTCRQEDAFGNDVPVAGWRVDAPEDVAVNGLDVTATVAGEYELACHLASGDDDALENRPATLTVRPGEATGIAVVATPARDWYAVGARITVGYEVRDAHGNAVAEDRGPLTVAIDPAAGLDPIPDDEGKYLFAAKGIYTIHGSVAGPPAGDAELTVVCDPDAPEIELIQPDRGLTKDGTPTVSVVGRVTDEIAGVAAVRVNGTDVAVAPDGSFSAPVSLRQGMTLIVVEAEDAVGHVAEVMRAVYYSPVWYAVDALAPLSGYVNDAILAYVGRLFFYAQDDPDKVTVSALVGDIVRGIDLAGLLPSPVTSTALPLCGSESDIFLDDVHYSLPAQVAVGNRTLSNPLLNPIDGGLHIFLVMTDLNAHLAIETPGGGLTCLNTEGRLLVDRITLTADVMISLDAQGQPVIDLQGVSIVVGSISTQGMGLTGGIVNLLAEWLDGFLGNMVEDMIVSQLVGLLGGLVGVLDLNFEFELGPFFGEGAPVPLRIETEFARFEFTGSDPGAGLHLVADGRITTTPVVERPVLGSIGRADCLGAPDDFALAEAGEVELGAAFDVLNEALFALWQGGLLHLTITAEDLGGTDLSQFGVTDLSVETAPLLPPIVTSCNEDGALVAQVGDFWVHATFGLFGTPTDVTAYLHAEIAAEPVVVDGENGTEPGIQIREIRMLRAEIVALNEEQERNRGMLLSLLEEALPTVLVSQVAADPISFAIPTIDLGSLDSSGMLPEGVVLQIVLDALGHELGYVTLEGHVDRAAAP